MNPLASLASASLWSRPPLAVAANLVVSSAFVLITGAIILDFVAYHRRDAEVVSSGRSLVETGSMTAFFVVYYLVLRFRLLEPDVSTAGRAAMIVAGLLLIVTGVAFNIWGRLLLKSRWANQIKIYADHTLVTSGPYAVVRHPLYASLIWIFVGGSLVYANPLSLTLTLGVFLPMMYVRAKQEDAMLLENFTEEYPRYRARTGMFFPRLWG